MSVARPRAALYARATLCYVAAIGLLQLTPDELLTTTRTVRKRLDTTRPVERGVVEECLSLAQQAPQSGNRQPWKFVVVMAPEKRAALGELYRRSLEIGYGGPMPRDPEAARTLADQHRGEQSCEEYLRILDSVIHLYDHIHEVPVHVIPCVTTVGEDEPARGFVTAGRWGCVIQGAWSFMLAARSRGLGTAWTTATLRFEREVAELLGIPHEEYMRAGLIPLAYTIGTDFKAGPRRPLETAIGWDGW